MSNGSFDELLALVRAQAHKQAEIKQARARFKVALGEGLLSKPLLLLEAEKSLKECSKAREDSLATLGALVVFLPESELREKIFNSLLELNKQQGEEEVWLSVKEECRKYSDK
ncbi:MAG: hypothetical protein AAB587_00195 [Patescibacteria group bacterium]